MSEEKTSTIATSCESCLLADRDNNLIQLGCKVNRLEKFAAKGARIQFDEVKNSFIIEGRVCLMCCTQSTVDKLNLVNPAEEMRKAIKVNCEGYILVEDDNTLEETKKTLNSLSQQTLRLSRINVVLNTDKVSRASLVKHCNELQTAFEGLGLDFNWNIGYINIEENGGRNSPEWCLDHAVHNCKSPFYCVFVAGQEAPTDYLQQIDKALNDDLERFSVLLPADDYWNGAFIQTILHKKLQGNLPETLEQYDDGELIATCLFDKVEYISEKLGQPHMSRKVTDICPSMKISE